MMNGVFTPEMITEIKHELNEIYITKCLYYDQRILIKNGPLCQ